MRELWRRTAALFWARPVLWVPLIVASLLAYGAEELRRVLNRWILLQLVESPASVLSNARAPLHPPAFSIPLFFIVSFSAWFLIVYIYSAAFVITARLVRDDKTTFTAARKHLEHSRIAGFAFKILALSTCLTIPSAPLTYISARYYHFALNRSFWYNHALTLLVALIVAACLAPSAIRLLRDRRETPVKGEARAMGIYFAIFVVCASQALQTFCDLSVRAHPSANVIAHTLIGLNVCVLTALPYIPLYIALALLADETAAQYNQN